MEKIAALNTANGIILNWYCYSGDKKHLNSLVIELAIQETVNSLDNKSLKDICNA
jgi:hypothetical protein